MYGSGPCERGQEVVEGGDGKVWDGVAGGYLGRGGQVLWGKVLEFGGAGW